MNSVTLLALLATSLTVLVVRVSSECCYVPYHCTEPDNKKVNRCYDCTEATVYCGLGKCNVFGCNCDNGCRAGNESLWCWNAAFNCGKHAKRDTVLDGPQIKLVSLVSRFDVDANQALDRVEFAHFLAQSPEPQLNAREEFSKLDVNHDGQITLNEIDESF